MEFNVEGKWCMERAADDLNMLGATFTVKLVQQLKIDATMAFLGIPITADPSILKELVDNVLKPLELKLMKEDPVHFPTSWHSRSDWVEYHQ